MAMLNNQRVNHYDWPMVTMLPAASLSPVDLVGVRQEPASSETVCWVLSDGLGKSLWEKREIHGSGLEMAGIAPWFSDFWCSKTCLKHFWGVISVSSPGAKWHDGDGRVSTSGKSSELSYRERVSKDLSDPTANQRLDNSPLSWMIPIDILNHQF